MNKQQVWQKMLTSLMSHNPRGIKNEQFFKIKHNGVNQVCLVACGCSQIPGVDFSKNYYLIVNIITFYIQLLMMIYFSYSAKMDNVETAFIYGYFKEEIYVEFPQGMSDVGNNDCITLNKFIYGLVQAARQYYKKVDNILKK